MLDKIKALWDRLRVRWGVLALAFVAALPEILNYLSGVDLRPILLSIGLPESLVGFIPFLLIFAKSVVHVEKPEEPK